MVKWPPTRGWEGHIESPGMNCFVLCFFFGIPKETNSVKRPNFAAAWSILEDAENPWFSFEWKWRYRKDFPEMVISLVMFHHAWYFSRVSWPQEFFKMTRSHPIHPDFIASACDFPWVSMPRGTVWMVEALWIMGKVSYTHFILSPLKPKHVFLYKPTKSPYPLELLTVF